jgi:hypothetical protein
MRITAQLALLLGLIFSSIQYSHAALLIEPVVGYNVSAKTDIENRDNYTGGMGAAYGGRLGYQNLGFQLGLDYLQSSIDLDDADFKNNLGMSEWAGFVGFEFPILFRVYAGYIFSATGEAKNSLNQDVKLNGGTGTKFGIGFTGLPFININFEFRRGSFDEIKWGGIKTSDKTDYSTYMIGISLPFAI